MTCDITPAQRVLAEKYNAEKKVCRVCHSRLPARAEKCRKRRCGNTTKVRIKKKLKD